MTREEAIDILRSYLMFDKSNMQIDIALNMAIEALENKPIPCEKCVHVKSCRKIIILKNRTYKLIKYCSQGAERREP